MIYILIAAFNEELDLPSLLGDIRSQNWSTPYTVVIVNDGSTDGTRAAIEPFTRTLPMVILDHPANLGLGRALATGLAWLCDRVSPDDILVTMDADRTHPADMVPHLAEAVRSGSDIVIASRFTDGGRQTGLPLYRSALSSGAGIVFRTLWRIGNVTDYTSGFRAFSGALVQTMCGASAAPVIEEKGFTATLELLLRASAFTDRIAEVPLVLRYDAKRGKSKMKVLKTLFRYGILLLGMRFSRMRRRRKENYH